MPQLSPQKLTAAEIKRRMKAVVDAARALGLPVGGVRMLPDYTIEILDSDSVRPKDEGLDRWV